MRARTGIVAVVAALALTLVPGAEAKAPPKGKYECTIGGNMLFGTITIKGKKKYRYSQSGGNGRFVAGKRLRKFSGGNVTGYSIRFKRGGLAGYKGYWFTSSTGTHEIALANPRDGFISIYCDD